MKDFIDKSKLMHASQYDFLTAHTPDREIHDRVETSRNDMDRRFSCGVFIDLKKGFWHSITKYYLINLIFMVFEGLSTSRSGRTWQIKRKLLTHISYQLN